MKLLADLPSYRALFPEHEPLANSLIELQLDEAREHLSACGWGRCYERALLLWTAHELALSQARQAGAAKTENGQVVVQASGTLTGATAAGVSVAFAEPPAMRSHDGAYFSQTPYGQRYLALMRECLSRGRVVGE